MTTRTTGLGAVEVHSRFEPILLDKICTPLLHRIPARVTPNTISLANSAACWLAFLFAALSPRLGPGAALAARILAGVATFATLVLDSLDGMHARRTGQCSRLGEVLDHWLDAIHVPLFGAAFILTIGATKSAVAVAGIASAIVYHAQLVIYHHRRVFVHPPTSGADSQFALALAYLALGGLFYLVPRTHPRIELFVLVLSWLIVATQLRQIQFYYARMRSLITHHLPFVALCASFAALYLLGVLGELAFLLLVVLVSFRITGTYVLRSVLGRPYGGFDPALALVPIALAAAHRTGAHALVVALPWLASGYMVARNVFDLARAMPALRRPA